jgi:hypothetical protein
METPPGRGTTVLVASAGLGSLSNYSSRSIAGLLTESPFVVLPGQNPGRNSSVNAAPRELCDFSMSKPSSLSAWKETISVDRRACKGVGVECGPLEEPLSNFR